MSSGDSKKCRKQFSPRFFVMGAWQSNEPEALFGADSRNGFARADEVLPAPPSSEESRTSIARTFRA
jgi:hypothetical protein